MSTIREVAALAGVSISTVSRVMNNDTTYKMTDETRDKVWRAIVELDYKAPASRHIPNSAQGLSAVRKIGCVIKTRGGKYSDPYYLSLLSGMEGYLNAHNAEVAFVRTWNELESSDVLLRTFSEPPDGLILMSHLGEASFRYALTKVKHIVGIDTGFSEIDNIEYDHAQAVHLGIHYLHQKGYRDIGFIGGPEGITPMRACRRFHSYINTMADLGLPVRQEHIIDCDWNDARCSKALRELGTGNMPRAFFVSSDLMAMATLRTLAEMKISVPEQVAVMGLTNIELSRYSNPPLTTIEIPIEAMGTHAAKTLLRRLDGEDDLPRRILFPGRLIVRDSV